MASPILKTFSQLDTQTLYQILALRSAVFVVEQNCVYQDVDGYDQQASHLILPHNGQIGAYCRIIPAGIKYPEWAIGRVVTAPQARGTGLGHLLIKEAIKHIQQQHGKSCRISAQAHLHDFYACHGFKQQGNQYLEDNIPHIEMLVTL